MDISRWHRNTSLLALSLSIDNALGRDNSRNGAICDLPRKEKNARSGRPLHRGSESQRALTVTTASMRWASKHT